MKKPTILLACLLCLTALGCRPHPGNGGAGRGEQGHGGLRRECRADIEQFCSADQTGRDRRQCLQSHIDKLSDACKAALAARAHRGGHRDRDQSQP